MRLVVLALLVACSGSTDKQETLDTAAAGGSGGSLDDSGTATDTASDRRDCNSPQTDPEDTWEGHPSDGWDWQKHGALFEDTETLGYTDGDLAPSLVDTGNELVLIFARKRGTQHTLLVSTSADGQSWTAPEPVEGLDVTSVEYPSLVYADGQFHLWHGSGSIAYSTSADGRTFSPQGTVLRTGESGAFDSLSLLYPHAVVDSDGVQLFYTGFDGARFAVGRTTSPAPGDEFASGTAILEANPAGWDNTSVGMPEVVIDSTGSERFWFGGYDTVIADPGPWRIGLWDPASGARTVSLPLAEAGLDAWSTRDPAVVRAGDGWLMVYVGMGDDGVYRLLRASSSVCN